MFHCGLSLSCSLLSTGENGVVTASARRGGSPVNATVTPASETPSKRPETPSKGSNGEEPSAAATPGRSSGKARQMINIKAELEKRQGGKPLLNLVVIGRKEPQMAGNHHKNPLMTYLHSLLHSFFKSWAQQNEIQSWSTNKLQSNLAFLFLTTIRCSCWSSANKEEALFALWSIDFFYLNYFSSTFFYVGVFQVFALFAISEIFRDHFI